MQGIKYALMAIAAAVVSLGFLITFAIAGSSGFFPASILIGFILMYAASSIVTAHFFNKAGSARE